MIKKLEIEILNSGHITNSYIVYNEDSNEAVLIDAPDKADIIIEEIEKLGVDLKYILLTHGHADHTMALEKLVKHFNVKVIANSSEKDMLLGIINDCSPVFGVIQPKREESMFEFLDDGLDIDIESMYITMYATPGHTKGCASYYFHDENALFTGDSMFADTVGRWDLETASLDDTLETTMKLYNTFKPLNTRIYPGHGESGMEIRDTYMKVSRVIFNATGLDLKMLK